MQLLVIFRGKRFPYGFRRKDYSIGQSYLLSVFGISAHDLHPAFVDVVEGEYFTVDNPLHAHAKIVSVLKATDFFHVSGQLVSVCAREVSNGYERQISVALVVQCLVQFFLQSGCLILIPCHNDAS